MRFSDSSRSSSCSPSASMCSSGRATDASARVSSVDSARKRWRQVRLLFQATATWRKYKSARYVHGEDPASGGGASSYGDSDGDQEVPLRPRNRVSTGTLDFDAIGGTLTPMRRNTVGTLAGGLSSVYCLPCVTDRTCMHVYVTQLISGFRRRHRVLPAIVVVTAGTLEIDTVVPIQVCCRFRLGALCAL